MASKRIRLKRDLPVEARHGCNVGNVYDVEVEVRAAGEKVNDLGRDRLIKVGFTAVSGVVVYAFRDEFEWYDDKRA